MTIKVRPYAFTDAGAWDAFCDKCLQATLLHTQRFLSYHGDKFEDKSLIIEQDGKWLGLFPAALSPVNAKIVVSHPGVTYGGIVHQGNLRGVLMIDTLRAIIQHYASLQLNTLIYKVVPFFYHQVPLQDDSYALFRVGASRTRCDISSTIDLQHRLPVSERRRRGLKNASKAGVSVVAGNSNLEALWSVLHDNLQRKHGVAPVHSLAEIELLAQKFPDHIQCICGVVNGKVEAGILVFVTPTAHHAQYIAASKIGYDAAALDAVFEFSILNAKEKHARWFSFGISTEDSGLILNDGLYRFKTEFGAGSAIHEFFIINLVKILKNHVN